MGRNAKNELGFGPFRPELLPQFLPAAAKFVVLNRIHGAAVAEKQHWRAGGEWQGLERGQAGRLCGLVHNRSYQEIEAASQDGKGSSFHFFHSILLEEPAGEAVSAENRDD
jgi:hypothetical protein